MPNNNTPFGFRSFGHRDGSAPTMGMSRFPLFSSDANLYFTGDPVALSSATGGLQPYFGSSVAPVLQGIFAGCEYYSAALQRVTWSSWFPGSVSAGTIANAYVIDDPDMQFIVQASSTQITSTMIGQVFTILASQSSLGNQATGISNVTLMSSAQLTQLSSNNAATAPGAPFKLVGLYSDFAPPSPGVNSGVDNANPYNIVVVVPNVNTHSYVGGVST